MTALSDPMAATPVLTFALPLLEKPFLPLQDHDMKCISRHHKHSSSRPLPGHIVQGCRSHFIYRLRHHSRRNVSLNSHQSVRRHGTWH